MKALVYEQQGPSWFLTMDDFLTIAVPVVKQKQTMYTAQYLHEQGHPEDLMIIVTDVVETVALTLVAIGQQKESRSKE